MVGERGFELLARPKAARCATKTEHVAGRPECVLAHAISNQILDRDHGYRAMRLDFDHLQQAGIGKCIQQSAPDDFEPQFQVGIDPAAGCFSRAAWPDKAVLHHDGFKRGLLRGDQIKVACVHGPLAVEFYGRSTDQDRWVHNGPVLHVPQAFQPAGLCLFAQNIGPPVAQHAGAAAP